MFRLIKNALYNLVFVLLVIIGTFILFSVLPSDPVRLILGVNASEDAIISLKNQLGLNKPLINQLLDYIYGLFTLDFGISYVTRKSVGTDLVNSFISTQIYAVIALIISIFYSIATVLVSFFTNSKVKNTFQTINSLFTSIPGLLLAISIGILFLKLNILGFIQDITLRQIISASIVLSIYPSSVLSQTLNNEFFMIRNKQFINASVSYGYERFQIFKIIFQNSYLPWLSQLSNIAASLIAGSIFVEYVFSLPGIGRLIYQSIIRHDYPMIQGIVILTTFSYLLFNFLIELLYNKLSVNKDVNE